MQSNPKCKKEYKDVNVEVILRLGDSFLPAQKIKCSLFRIYSEPHSPHSGISQCEAMARIDQREIRALAEKGYVMLDAQSYASFIHEGITWDVYDSTMYQENNNAKIIDFWDYHLNKKPKSEEQ